MSSRRRAVLPVLLLLLCSACTAPETPFATPADIIAASDRPVRQLADETPIDPSARFRVGLVDAPIREGGAFECFILTGRLAQDEPVNEPHGEQVASVILGLVDDPCPPWANAVELRAYPAGSDYAADPNEVADAVRRATRDNVTLLSMSITFAEDYPQLEAAIAEAVDEGMIIVAAAGNNEGRPAGYPARYPGVLSVGAATNDGSVAKFTALDHVDVFAVGEDIPVVDFAGNRDSKSGTSVAAASVCHQYLNALIEGTPVDKISPALLSQISLEGDSK